MKNRRVEITITDGVELLDSYPEDVVITGRLLGAVTIIESTKILQNEEIYRRMATCETKKLDDVLKGLDTIAEKNNGNDRYGRLVVAVKSIQLETETEGIDSLTKQLYLTPPIDMIAETSRSAGLAKAQVWIGDNIMTIEEKEI